METPHFNIHATRESRDGTARFSIWSSAASLTPIIDNLSWPQAIAWLVDFGYSPAGAAECLKRALVVFDLEAGNGADDIAEGVAAWKPGVADFVILAAADWERIRALVPADKVPHDITLLPLTLEVSL